MTDQDSSLTAFNELSNVLTKVKPTYGGEIKLDEDFENTKTISPEKEK